MKSVDLHCHSIYSDGSLSVEKLFKIASEKKLAAFTISDHDNFEAYEEAEYFSKKLGIETMRAVEVSTILDGKNIHILAYGIPSDSRMLNSQLSRTKNSRVERAKKMLQKLHSLNINITFEEIQKLGKTNIGRPHFAKLLIQKNYAKNIDEAFDKYLAEYAPAYVPLYKLRTDQAISMINNAGGVSIVAHVGRYKSKKRIKQLLDFGVQGFEIFHPSHNKEISRELIELTEKYGLLKTGGSDFHSFDGYNSEIGSQNVPYEFFEKLKRALK
jgi:predicted metal-dependent phosphoesterase TrpH